MRARVLTTISDDLKNGHCRIKWQYKSYPSTGGRSSGSSPVRAATASLGIEIVHHKFNTNVAHIPQRLKKRFLRLVSAHADIGYAIEAYQVLQHAHSTPADYSLFLSIVVCYCRPFTQNRGIGSLLCEYPDYPDWPDPDECPSSEDDGYPKLLSPGSKHPETGDKMTVYYYAVAKRQFLHPEFSAWLYQLVDALFRRLDEDIRTVSKEIGATYLKEAEMYQFATGVDAFVWTPPKKG